MKFLKKTFAYILPAMMVLGGATACTDFIEIDPENKVPEQGVDFTNKNNMYQPVVGAYSKVLIIFYSTTKNRICHITLYVSRKSK